jgi:hypothetical protein
MRACHMAFLDLLKDILERSHDDLPSQTPEWKQPKTKNLKQ